MTLLPQEKRDFTGTHKHQEIVHTYILMYVRVLCGGVWRQGMRSIGQPQSPPPDAVWEPPDWLPDPVSEESGGSQWSEPLPHMTDDHAVRGAGGGGRGGGENMGEVYIRDLGIGCSNYVILSNRIWKRRENAYWESVYIEKGINW